MRRIVLKKSPAAHCIFGAQGLGLSNALVPTIIRQQIFSDGDDARSFAFRANSDFRQSQFQSTRHHSLRKDAAATEMDCAFIVVKARQRSQVDSCSLPPYWVSASCGPLADAASSHHDTSPPSASKASLLLSGVTVNALAFTFRIAYQKAGCSIFVPVIRVHR